jgi:glycosyltransferase involved in cell wall biosynthesis
MIARDVKRTARVQGSQLRVLMVGPVPRIYGGISAVAGAILDSDLPNRCNLTYLAEGTRQGLLAKVRSAVTATARLVWLLARRQADVLHLHVGDGSSFYRHMVYAAVGWLARTPVLLHWHSPGTGEARDAGLTNGLQRGLARWGVNHAARVFVLSPAWAEALAMLSGHPVAGRRIVVLPNPVDCDLIRPPDDPAQRQAEDVLFLGDFSRRKGVRDLLAAAPAVLQRHPAARFVLAGGAPPADVAAQAEPLGAAVQFPGFVRGADKVRWLQEAALLALPSYAEGLPVAVLEAMAAGLPVVTTPVGGVPDIFRDGVNGLLTPPGDLPALADALSRLLADADLRQSMGRHNRQQALQQFAVPQYVQCLLEVYYQVVGRLVDW